MSRPSPTFVALVAACTLLAGCKGGVATGADPGKRTVPGPTAGHVIQDALVTTLTGKVKLISDNGGGLIGKARGDALISDAGDAVVSNADGNLIGKARGDSVISDAGSSIIGHNAAGLIGKARFGLLQAAPPTDPATVGLALADAVVSVFDAAGKPVLDARGKQLSATTDLQGRYTIATSLPPGNVVLQIALHDGGFLHGGQLAAMVAHPGGAEVQQAIDTSTSLGAAYVLQKYVHGSQATFDKLPSTDALKLESALDAAASVITTAPDYHPDALVGLMDQVRAKAPPVGQELDTIKALLLGQANLGDGLQGSHVPLFIPTGLALLPNGDLLVAEQTLGRVRRVAQDGTISTFADVVHGTFKQNFPHLVDFAVMPDGGLVVAQPGLVNRLKPDGTFVTIAGSTSPVSPLKVAAAPDGTVYVGESAGPNASARLLSVTPDGQQHTLSDGLGWGPGGEVSGLVVEPDGALVFMRHFTAGSQFQQVLYRLRAGGKPEAIASGFGLRTEGTAGLARGADGTLYVAEDLKGCVTAIAPDGTRRVVAGAGGPALTQDLVRPSSLAVAKDGTLLVEDLANNLVKALAPDGSWTTRVGSTSNDLGGSDFRTLAFNGPTGASYDAQGRLVIAERGGNALRQFDGQSVSTIAGGSAGFAGDGGPAAKASFNGPIAVCASKGTLYVVDTVNGRIRTIAADGTVQTLVGNNLGSVFALNPGQTCGPDELPIAGRSVAVAPDGTPYWTMQPGQIMRLRNGRVELLAGKAHAASIDKSPEALNAFLTAPATGQTPASDMYLLSPQGLAFDAHGDLFVADAVGMRVYKISGLDGGAPVSEPVAGAPASTLLGRTDEVDRNEEGVPALDASLVAPAGLAFDPAGNMFVSEMGSVALPLLVATNGGQSDLVGKLFPKPIYARICKIGPDGTIHTVVGPKSKFFADPTAEDALVLPAGLAFGPDGRLAIADGGANLVRILPAGL